MELGTHAEITNIPDVRVLEEGMDFREPKYRREVFLRFYEFHLKHRAHPGGVYFAFPWLQKEFNLTKEQMYWLTYINGMSQHIITTWDLFLKFPEHTSDAKEMQTYILDNWKRLGWDMDRRYMKTKFGEALQSYQSRVGDRTQVEFWDQHLCASNDPYVNFEVCWEEVMTNFKYFGRLASFSYLEYQRIVGANLDCNNLFLEDMSGSKSHRNGLFKVAGRDDRDWWDKLNPDWTPYSKEEVQWIKNFAEELLAEAKSRIDHPDVSHFTMESTLCCYKSWHRPKRRYPNVYMDMMHDRIKKAEANGEDREITEMFWRMRDECLPDYLLQEKNPGDVGLVAEKQNHYLETGEVIMMHNEWPEFSNGYHSKSVQRTKISEFFS